MSECNRFEKEGLQLLELGQELGEHFADCESCIEAKRQYDALKILIADDGLDSLPNQSWQNEVLDSIQQRERSDQMQNGWINDLAAKLSNWRHDVFGTSQWQDTAGQRWSVGTALSIVAIAFTGLLFMQQGIFHSDPIKLEFALVSSGKVYRGQSANVGDTLNIKGTTTDTSNFQLRIYRDNRLESSCANKLVCEHQGDQVATTAELQALGEYQIVLFQSKEPIELSEDLLDADVSYARELNADVVLSEPISVQ